MPLVAADYCFLNLGTETEKGEPETATVLVVADGRSGACCSSMVPAKGLDAFGVRIGCRFLDELGYQNVLMQSDGEPAITAWAKKVRQEWFRVTDTAGQLDAEKQMPLRHSPKDDHASNGVIESVVHSVEGIVRTLRFSTEHNLRLKIGPTSPLLPWIVRHAGFLITRFQVRPSGRTPFEELRMVKYTSPILQLFEKVIAKEVGVTDQKLQGPWQLGLWLGRSTDTNEHLVSTETGVVRARTVRRVVPEDQWDKTLAEKSIWLPWASDDSPEARAAPSWTPTEGCRACEEELQPIRRRGRPAKHTPACRQRMPPK